MSFPAERSLQCPDCKGPMKLGERFGKYSYLCLRAGCSGSHGAHPSGEPFGIPGDFKTRKARSLAHITFDRIWELEVVSRSEAYVWLAGIVGKDPGEAHIGSMDVETCKRVVQAVKEKFPDLFPFSEEVP